MQRAYPSNQIPQHKRLATDQGLTPSPPKDSDNGNTSDDAKDGCCQDHVHSTESNPNRPG